MQFHEKMAVWQSILYSHVTVSCISNNSSPYRTGRILWSLPFQPFKRNTLIFRKLSTISVGLDLHHIRTLQTKFSSSYRNSPEVHRPALLYTNSDWPRGE